MVSTGVASHRQRFRDLIMAPEMLVLPGAWDGMSALLIEQAGFQGVYITGGGIARSSGVPDIGLVTMSEQIARVRMICEVVSVPVLADADTGYGNALNLMRAVREMEAAGAACSISKATSRQGKAQEVERVEYTLQTRVGHTHPGYHIQ